MTNELQNTTWDNTNIYKNFQDPKIQEDLIFIESEIEIIKSKTKEIEPLISKIETMALNQLEGTIPLTREIKLIENELIILINTLSTFAYSKLSTDTIHQEAKDLSNKIRTIYANLSKASTPLNLFLMRASDEYISEFLNDETTQMLTANINYQRQEKDFLLSVSEEVLATGLSQNGIDAWGKLYNELCGTLKIDLDGKQIGLAEASSLLRQDGRERRETSYRAIHKTFNEHQVSFTAILNSINGWRWEMNRTRSNKRELHYLDKACYESKIERATLNVMMDTTYEQRSIGHKAIRGMAKTMGLNQLAPWDLLAPMPSTNDQLTENISFSQAMNLISEAFAKLSPEMADFAMMMYKKNWIDGLPTANRSQGAYCTGFANAREPRVFMTYNGSMGDVITLAHELGHAYHSWVMRDLPFPMTSYPMTLAETASIFAETLVKDALIENAGSEQERKTLLWQEVESASAFLINIPSRFTFERDMVEKRKNRELSFNELNTLMNDNWKHWYEDTLSEYDSLFWATKLHFSISQIGFYNYPYLFGYLFSLGIYAKKDQYGDKFHELYKNILRDTGIMSAEELIKKHFNQDIREKSFWEGSLKIVERSVDKFISLP